MKKILHSWLLVTLSCSLLGFDSAVLATSQSSQESATQDNVKDLLQDSSLSRILTIEKNSVEAEEKNFIEEIEVEDTQESERQNSIETEESTTDNTISSEEKEISTESSSSTVISSIEDQTTKESESTDKKIEPRISSRVAGEQDVGTWAQFVSAIGNATISKIRVLMPLTATTAAKVNHNVEIDFMNNVVDMKARAIEVPVGISVSASNVQLNGTKTGSLFKGKGAVVFTGKLTTSTTNEASIASMSGGSFTFSGANVTYDNGTSSKEAIISKTLIIEKASTVISNAEKFYGISALADVGAIVTINGGSKVTTNSMKGLTGNLHGQAWNMARQTTFIVDGSGTELNVTGNGNQQADDGGVFDLQADNSTINIQNGAVMKAHATQTSAVLLQSSGGSINVSNNSKLLISQDDDHGYALGSALRFRIKGDMTFNISNNSTIEVIKYAGPTSAIRMFGSNNKINISGGSNFKVVNYGDGIAKDPGANARNQAIHFDSGGASEFNLTGNNSNVEVDSYCGAAIDSELKDLTVTADEGTYFVARGKTATANKGIFSAGQLTFNMTKPKYYDFRNDRVGGGNVLSASKATSNFTSVQSDLSVWSNGSNLNSEPTYGWSMIDYALTGVNLATLALTSSPTMKTQFGSLTNYTRMTANNQNPIFDSIRVPTDADKYVYAHVSIPEGKEDSVRSAYKDEVTAKVGIYNTAGMLLQTVQARSDSVSIYGEAPAMGTVKIPIPNGAFLTEKYTIKPLESWTGTSATSAGGGHVSTPQDITASAVTVVSVTPPKPATLSKSSVTPNETTISGTGTSGTEVSVWLNGKDSGIKGTVAANGEFSVNLPATKKAGDTMQVVLRDKKGSAIGVKGPPTTNNATGNGNPLAAYSYHDAIFPAAAKLSVSDAGTLEFYSVPQEFDFGSMAVNVRSPILVPKVTGSLVVNDQRPAGDDRTVKVYVKQGTPLTVNGKQITDGLSYIDIFSKEKQITDEYALAEAFINNNNGNFNITSYWNDTRGLRLKIPIEQQLIGTYSGSLTWSLQNVP
ncbi:Ig-like domain-containing protein [Enterococcus thailandicus]|uniref:Ig-like domain-containing protein n=1 Tax=Enterococcus thailandicus TaxID=417368 RepID=UPI0022EBB944|nr:Ig-like domain-containing protein [Enterococcus thailandicus]MDA3972746.1 Ig-like domain-containing protein [Enterococcus thailandicus]MDA3975242.1 Ig-like domain-containing protein [Enterococcus thailandicus]MDA3980206.1 Ig-like domain-containing protein [Enterococcus thailandicus]